VGGAKIPFTGLVLDVDFHDTRRNRTGPREKVVRWRSQASMTRRKLVETGHKKKRKSSTGLL